MGFGYFWGIGIDGDDRDYVVVVVCCHGVYKSVYE